MGGEWAFQTSDLRPLTSAFRGAVVFIDVYLYKNERGQRRRRGQTIVWVGSSRRKVGGMFMGFHHPLQFPMPVRQEPSAYGRATPPRISNSFPTIIVGSTISANPPAAMPTLVVVLPMMARRGGYAQCTPESWPLPARLLRLVTVHVTVDTSMKPNVYAGRYGVTVRSPWMPPLQRTARSPCPTSPHRCQSELTFAAAAWRAPFGIRVSDFFRDSQQYCFYYS